MQELAAVASAVVERGVTNVLLGICWTSYYELVVVLRHLKLSATRDFPALFSESANVPPTTTLTAVTHVRSLLSGQCDDTDHNHSCIHPCPLHRAFAAPFTASPAPAPGRKHAQLVGRDAAAYMSVLSLGQSRELLAEHGGCSCLVLAPSVVSISVEG